MAKRGILPLQMDCMMLFQSNPSLTVTVEELVGKMGETYENLQPVLDLLLKQGIIRKSGEIPALLFSYQEPVTVAEFEFDVTDREIIQ
ncbi:hypothetical protein [Planomicrobium sp. Y74]|uniref:hypothetical protein n=1 Tax=Planomicrobium sp. Y74 TaxID=2478977 RepID=UPI000EF52EF2|nr:hypothetical protein [Planomicrobium sp. Y74]RLQ84890.1 hypothetical protein D9754_16600 [Planomicrobium sp. Y74]